ncbi:MAG: nuclear transport factor 2 family protein [Sphingomicrobium sp.]
MSVKRDNHNNRAIIAGVMESLANGDGRPLLAAMHDDVRWILEGSTAWSGRYEGKQAVRDRLLKPLFEQFATRYRNRAERIIADGDDVVVLCRGYVETVRGERYDNSSCYVMTMSDGQIVELREYLDTALVDRVLAPPVTTPN